MSRAHAAMAGGAGGGESSDGCRVTLLWVVGPLGVFG
jgi:hypothetical protein